MGASAALLPVHADSTSDVGARSEDLPPTIVSVEAVREYLDPLCLNRPPDDAPDAVTDALCEMEAALIRLTDGRRTASVTVLVASRSAHKWAGYQNVGPEVMARTAVLFVEQRDIWASFHMCNVRAALDMAWIRSDGTFIDVQRAEPGPAQSAFTCPSLYFPRTSEGFRYVLETPPGLYEALGLEPASLRLLLPL